MYATTDGVHIFRHGLSQRECVGRMIKCAECLKAECAQQRLTTTERDIWSVHVDTSPRTQSFSGMWCGSKLSRAPFQSTTTRHTSQCPLLRCNSKTVSVRKVLFLSEAKPLFVNSPFSSSLDFRICTSATHFCLSTQKAAATLFKLRVSFFFCENAGFLAISP